MRLSYKTLRAHSITFELQKNVQFDVTCSKNYVVETVDLCSRFAI